MKVRCVIAQEVNRIIFAEHSLREPHEGEVLVETIYSAISPGTELRCLAGKEPNAPRFPMITGYSLVGRVLCGSGSIRKGEHVFLNGTPICPEGIASSWGGHLSHAIALAANVARLPSSVDLKMASALSMLSIAMHGVCKAAPLPGDRVLVVGQGLIGQFAAVFLKLAGCQVAVCDKWPQRLDLSRHMGAEHCFVAEENWKDQLRRLFPDGVDIMCDATGSPVVVKKSLPLLRDKSWDNPYESSPRLVLLASYPGEIVLDYQQTLFNKETEVIACRTYLPHERERVVRLLAAGRLDVSPVLCEVLSAEQAADAFRHLREDPRQHITFILDWRGRT